MKNKYDLVIESTNMTKEDHNSVLLKVERTIYIISDDLDRAHNISQENYETKKIFTVKHYAPFKNSYMKNLLS